MHMKVIVIKATCSCQDLSHHVRTMKDYASVVICCYVCYMLKNALRVVWSFDVSVLCNISDEFAEMTKLTMSLYFYDNLYTVYM